MRIRLLAVAATAAIASASGPARAADAGTKTLIDCCLPTPIVCPLTLNAWDAPGVVPRDVCNGLEDSTHTQWQYWDGKILVGADGSYHMYAGRWPQASGSADWPNSVIGRSGQQRRALRILRDARESGDARPADASEGIDGTASDGAGVLTQRRA